VASAGTIPATVEVGLVTDAALPLEPGDKAEFSVHLTNLDGPNPIQVRLFQVDFSDTDAALTVSDLDWRYPGLISDALYAEFKTLPVVSTVYVSVGPIPGFILALATGAKVEVLNFTVEVADDLDHDAVLDVINADAGDPNFGARLDFDFVTPTTLTFPAGELVLGQLLEDTNGGAVVATPEPASLGLLALGALAGLRRRRAA